MCRCMQPCVIYHLSISVGKRAGSMPTRCASPRASFFARSGSRSHSRPKSSSGASTPVCRSPASSGDECEPSHDEVDAAQAQPHSLKQQLVERIRVMRSKRRSERKSRSGVAFCNFCGVDFSRAERGFVQCECGVSMHLKCLTRSQAARHKGRGWVCDECVAIGDPSPRRTASASIASSSPPAKVPPVQDATQPAAIEQSGGSAKIDENGAAPEPDTKPSCTARLWPRWLCGACCFRADGERQPLVR